jgi:hypothetical protein
VVIGPKSFPQEVIGNRLGPIYLRAKDGLPQESYRKTFVLATFEWPLFDLQLVVALID